MLDDLDRRLLRRLQLNPAISMGELAELAGTTAAVASRRLAHLRDNGILRGSRARIDWRALGYSVEVSLRFTLDKTQRLAFDEFIAAARGVPEVTEIQTFLGQVDVRLNVIARDMPHYQQVYRESILALPHIADIEALMQVARIKNDEVLPV
ncbi:Lrp/AsnC family transcriptional regulator [Poseidonocella pacifica]|uniref:Lrp/AsnC family transcriptional regulator n=1 Tax=Poseidonocella pacifica TaxID=871651 RepID=A0A1I0W980_9RHOB|nr:Lrp/AsnC family transcriptional regulator [Poseidonocella pacifica]SFA85161.1 Lrp/AsnC family transcriptional regulator [Poseidonocella pacifica]